MTRRVLNIRKCTKYHLKRQFTEKQILMKRRFSSLAFTVMQSKVTISCQIIGIRLTKMKKLDDTIYWAGFE